MLERGAARTSVHFARTNGAMSAGIPIGRDPRSRTKIAAVSNGRHVLQGVAPSSGVMSGSAFRIAR